MFTNFKFSIKLELFIWKKHVENKAKVIWHYIRMQKNIIQAFTLAEVLITLLIIGVVASLTIPALISEMQDQQDKVAYKKAFAEASQVWHTMVVNQENEQVVSGKQGICISNNFNTFKSRFMVTQDCMSGNNSFDCWLNGERFFSQPQNNALSFIDTSGMTWSTACSNCTSFEFYVDINSQKPPNRWGKDRFVIYPQTNGTVKVPSDWQNTTNTWCPSGDCYYKSWLYN